MPAAGPRIAYTCSYTPLPLLAAAGFTPWRLLPMTSAPERAGALLHDNVCPLVKRMLDRALADDLPELAGLVVMGSCETMRRFADAWPAARPQVPAIVVDLPVAASSTGIAIFADELRLLGRWLEERGGRPVTPAALARSVGDQNAVARRLAALEGRIPASALQALRLRSVSLPVERALEEEPEASAGAGVPVMLTGNMLPDPEAFAFLEQCGLEVVRDDLCTGRRQLVPLALDGRGDPFGALARAVLGRPPCARTLVLDRPGDLADRVLAEAKAAGARGVVAHVLKFCDPYLGRLPAVRDGLRAAGLPLLVLEGDCTLRSFGQFRTRLEAFAETLTG